MKRTNPRNTHPQNEKKHDRQLHDIPRNVPVHQQQIRRSNQGQRRCRDGESRALPVYPLVSNWGYRCEYQDYGSEGEIFEVFDSGGCVSEVVGRDSDGPFHGGEEAAPRSKPAVATSDKWGCVVLRSYDDILCWSCGNVCEALNEKKTKGATRRIKKGS